MAAWIGRFIARDSRRGSASFRQKRETGFEQPDPTYLSAARTLWPIIGVQGATVA